MTNAWVSNGEVCVGGGALDLDPTHVFTIGLAQPLKDVPRNKWVLLNLAQGLSLSIPKNKVGDLSVFGEGYHGGYSRLVVGFLNTAISTETKQDIYPLSNSYWIHFGNDNLTGRADGGGLRIVRDWRLLDIPERRASVVSYHFIEPPVELVTLGRDKEDLYLVSEEPVVGAQEILEKLIGYTKGKFESRGHEKIITCLTEIMNCS
jgi:hypothetical protein